MYLSAFWYYIVYLRAFWYYILYLRKFFIKILSKWSGVRGRQLPLGGLSAKDARLDAKVKRPLAQLRGKDLAFVFSYVLVNFSVFL